MFQRRLAHKLISSISDELRLEFSFPKLGSFAMEENLRDGLLLVSRWLYLFVEVPQINLLLVEHMLSCTGSQMSQPHFLSAKVKAV